MAQSRSANEIEPVQRIEPTRLAAIEPAIADLATDIAAAGATLGASLPARSAASLADLVRIMNAYASNLIEGHNTRPRDIARALAGNFDDDPIRRDLQHEAAAHVRVQAEVDALAARDALPEPASCDFIVWLHTEFYRDAPDSALHVRPSRPEYRMLPGQWRSTSDDDVVVGRHQPPSSERVPAFMDYFSRQFQFASMGSAERIIGLAIAHHRFNYIHPFPDGNGRVSRLMTHAMSHKAGIGAHGLWSVSRGLARGIDHRAAYKRMMDSADTPRQSDLDGRGNLSLRSLIGFVEWFLRVCLDQLRFMAELFDFTTLSRRLRELPKKHDTLRPQTGELLAAVLARGTMERGDAASTLQLPERSARRVLNDAISAGLLASDSPKGAVSLRFPIDFADELFPRLFSSSELA